MDTDIVTERENQYTPEMTKTVDELVEPYVPGNTTPVVKPGVKQYLVSCGDERKIVKTLGTAICYCTDVLMAGGKWKQTADGTYGGLYRWAEVGGVRSIIVYPIADENT